MGIISCIIAAKKGHKTYACVIGIWTAIAVVLSILGFPYALGPGFIFLIIAISMEDLKKTIEKPWNIASPMTGFSSPEEAEFVHNAIAKGSTFDAAKAEYKRLHPTSVKTIPQIDNNPNIVDNDSTNASVHPDHEKELAHAEIETNNKAGQSMASPDEVIEHIKSSLGKAGFELVSFTLSRFPLGISSTDLICKAEAVLLNVVTLYGSDEPNTLRTRLLLTQYEGLLNECKENKYNYNDSDYSVLSSVIMPLHDKLISDDIIETKVKNMASSNSSSGGVLINAYTSTLFEILGVKATYDEYDSMLRRMQNYHVEVMTAFSELKDNRIIDTDYLYNDDTPNPSNDNSSNSVSSKVPVTTIATQERIKVSFCMRCGSKLVDGASFCKECGLPVVDLDNKNTNIKSFQFSDELPKEGSEIEKNEESKKEKTLPIIEIEYHNSKLHPKIRRAFLFIEDGEWDRADAYLEDVLDEDPTSAYAYLGKLMIDLKLKSTADLKNYAAILGENKYYKKAVRFATDNLSQFLVAILEA